MSDSTQRPPRGLAGDIHRARTGAKASAAELTEFVREFRGRSPQEVLGIVTGSGLVQSTVVATVITLVLMVGFTIIPYMLSSPKTAAVPAPAPSAAPAAPAAPVAASTAATPAAPVAAASTPSGPAGLGAPPEPGVPSPDAVNKLGIGESKNADPKKNPLEAGADDLLKDLK